MKNSTEVLNRTHQDLKINFHCGKDLLDNYLKHQASQDIRKKLSVCFVLVDNDENQIKGYYTLSNNSISFDYVPESFKKIVPKSYTSVPVTLLGRLAVDKKYTGKGIGKLLLIDALRKSYEISNVVGSFAVIVDPIDKEAKAFYFKYGFILLPDSGKMFLPMITISQLFED